MHISARSDDIESDNEKLNFQQHPGKRDTFYYTCNVISPELVCRELSFFVVWLHSNLQKPFRKESSREMQSLNGPGFVVIYHLTTMFSMINENKTLSIMIGQQYCHLSFNTTLSFIIWHQYCHLSFAINVVIYHLITLLLFVI